VVVYATCTFAPEENEEVLQTILGDQGRIVPFDCPLPSMPGLSAFGGTTFRQDMLHARRFYPHLSDTGGFFVAKIIVDAPKPGRRREREPVNTRQAVDAADATSLWRDRFGVPASAFEGISFSRRGQRVIWAAASDTEPGPHLQPESVGMVLSRVRGIFPKPTTNAILTFGDGATRNVVDLSDEDAQRFLHRDIFTFDAGGDADDGYVIVRWRGQPLGCGLYLGGRISSQLSKGRALRSRAASEAPDPVFEK
jgi:hypothetical protein